MSFLIKILSFALSNKMKFTEEDEHYIQEISPSQDGSTCIVKRTEKPKRVILWRKLTDGNYEFLVKTNFEEQRWYNLRSFQTQRRIFCWMNLWL